jgi:hypothetical protein
VSTFRFYDGKEILYGKVVIIIVKNLSDVCTRKSRTQRRDNLPDLISHQIIPTSLDFGIEKKTFCCFSIIQTEIKTFFKRLRPDFKVILKKPARHGRGSRTSKR